MPRWGQSEQRSGRRCCKGCWSTRLGAVLPDAERGGVGGERNSPVASVWCALLALSSGGSAGRPRGEVVLNLHVSFIAVAVSSRMSVLLRQRKKHGGENLHTQTFCRWESEMREILKKCSERRLKFTKTYNYTITPYCSKERSFLVTSNTIYASRFWFFNKVTVCCVFSWREVTYGVV